MGRYRRSSELFKLLAHPERLRLLHALRSGEECVCHLTAVLCQRQAYVSQQLMVMRQAGLLQDRKDGLRVYYRVREPRLFDLLDAASGLAGMEDRSGDLKALKGCSCPKCASRGGARSTRRHRSDD